MKTEIVDNNKLPSIIEAKLTKGEMVDILLAEVRRQLKAEVTAIEDEIKALPYPPQRALAQLFTKKPEYTVSASFDRWRGPTGPYVAITMERNDGIELGLDDVRLPESVRKWAEKRLALCKRRDAAKRRVEDFDRRKSDAKTMALRDVLERTAEGRVLLEQIEVLKLAAMQRMQLTAGDAA